MKKGVFVFLMLLAVLTFSACTKDDNEKKEDITTSIKVVEGDIKVDENSKSLEIGDKSTINIKIEPDNATEKEIIWDSDAKDIATVDSKGVVTALKVGNALITAKLKNGKSVEIKVEVKAISEKILKADEYIEIDKNTVKFLFKTDLQSKVTFSYGETSENLNNIKVFEKNDNKGVKIDGFKPGVKYFYRIESTGVKNRRSSIQEFTKTEKVLCDKNAEWARTAVFYEIFVRSFYDTNNDGIGDFKGLTKKIDYLKELGVNAVWLMPIFDSPSYHGYDTIDYYKIQPQYGTNQDFLEFVKECHKNGIKVIIDMVINHTGIDIKWAKDSFDNKESIYRNYYVWSEEFDNVKEIGPWGQSVWSKYKNYYYYSIFWSGMPDLNFRNYTLREEIKKIAKYWLDPNSDGDVSDGVDGFRMDASMHLDTDEEVTHSWWQEYNGYVKSINKDAFIVGENWTGTAGVAPFFKDMDSSFNFAMSLDGNSMRYQNTNICDNLKQVYSEYSKYNKNFIDSRMLTNHDMDRVGSIYKGNTALEKMAATVLLTLPGTPFIYYGEEIGQKGAGIDQNKREGFDWYKSATGEGITNRVSKSYTKADDGISLEEQVNDPNSLYNYYKKLISIRKNYPEFATAIPDSIASEAGTQAYEWSSKEGFKMRIILNNESVKKSVKIDRGDFTKVDDLLHDKDLSKDNSVYLNEYESVILKFSK